MRARPVTAITLTRPHMLSPSLAPWQATTLAWAHAHGLAGRERINRSDEAGDFTGLTQPTRNLFRTARVYREWARELSETDATWEAFDVKDYVKNQFPNVDYEDLLFPGPHGPKSITKTAWVVPIASQTASTGTLADFLRTLGAAVTEVDLDAEDGDSDEEDERDGNALVDDEAEEEEEEE